MAENEWLSLLGFQTDHSISLEIFNTKRSCMQQEGLKNLYNTIIQVSQLIKTRN